jgi:hypothetical protein
VAVSPAARPPGPIGRRHAAAKPVTTTAMQTIDRISRFFDIRILAIE